jgi:single-stranded-DNA-specific exonuclease
VNLLLAEDLETARPLARRCHETNSQRREIQQKVEVKAHRLAQERLSCVPPDKVLLLWDAEWHPGVVGIVAGRLRERYARPAIVCGWHPDGYWRGSGRSPDAFDLGAAVQAAQDAGLLLTGGGHRAAAGMKIAPDKVDQLRSWLSGYCRLEEEEFSPVHEVLAPVDALAGERVAGAEAKDLCRAWCGLLSQLEPFGAGNPSPSLILKNAELRWGPRGKNRKDGGERWAVSGGFSWSGRGYLFADWTHVSRADEEWSLGGRYDLVLQAVRSEGTDRLTGGPVAYHDWRVADCARVS